MDIRAIFNPYWGPGPARPIPIVQQIYGPQLSSMVEEARRKPGLYTNTVQPMGSVQTAALLLGPGVVLQDGD